MTHSHKQQVFRFGLSAAFWFFVIGLIRYLHRPFGLDFDGAEQSYLSQWFELGSGIQPPLPSWLFYATFDLLGYSVAWVHCVRLSLIFLIYLGFYRLSLKIIKTPVLALMTMLSLVFIFQFSSVMLKQMHTVFITLAVIYGWLCIVNILEKGHVKSFIWLGFWFGVGFLSKYNFFIHALALLLATALIPSVRKNIFQAKLLLSVVLAFAICSPHYFWILDNLDAVRSGIGSDLAEEIAKSSLGYDFLKGFSALLLKILSFCGILILIFLAFFFTPLKANFRKKEDPIIRLMGTYMIIALIILISVILFTGATRIHEHWLQPFLIIFPILLFQKLKGSEEKLKSRFRLLKIICLSLFVVISIDFSLKSYVRLYTGHPASVFNVPYKNIADFILEYSHGSDIVFTQDPITAGHMKLMMPEKLVLVYDDLIHLAKEEEAILNASSMVFIWKTAEGHLDIPIDPEFLSKAINSEVSVAMLDPEWATYNYVMTDQRQYHVGISKLAFTNK